MRRNVNFTLWVSDNMIMLALAFVWLCGRYTAGTWQEVAASIQKVTASDSAKRLWMQQKENMSDRTMGGVGWERGGEGNDSKENGARASGFGFEVQEDGGVSP